jgi:hypothetical protein
MRPGIVSPLVLPRRSLLPVDSVGFHRSEANAMRQNPNIEYRNPKQTRKSNFQMLESWKQQINPGC